MPTALVIGNITISQDLHGRYRLNDLFYLSGARATKNPGEWLKNKATQELIAELTSQKGNSPLDVVKGGEWSGTYADELLAVSYAGWISPSFQLRVNRAFLDQKYQQSRMPQVQDPTLQMVIDLAMRLDAVQTEAKDAKQLAQLALEGQEWITLRQYVLIYQLERQLPTALQQRYSKWLVKYCLDNNIPVYELKPADRVWTKENTYHAGTIHKTLAGWLARQHGQQPLKMLGEANRA